MNWDSSVQAAAQPEPPVSLVISAAAAQGQAYYTSLIADERFAVLALATSPADARAKLALHPELVLVEAGLFEDAAAFAQALGAYRGIAYAILSPALGTSAADAVKAVSCVQKTVSGQTNFVELAGDMYATVRNARRTAAPGGSFAGIQPPGLTTVGWRGIAVWSPQGGVGKSTLALALAMEARQRRLPVLLAVLAAPDMTPLILAGIRPEPNFTTWRAQPDPDGLRAAVQVHKQSGLPVLGGFRDAVALGAYSDEAQEGPTSLSALAYAAALSGYGIVILDCSAPEITPAALSAANTLLLVARPDPPGVHSALEGLRLVQDVMAGRHAIPPTAVHLVVNRARDTTLRPEEVVGYGKRERRDFPPLAAAVADDPNIELAVNSMEPAYYRSEALRTAMRSLGDLLFPAALAAPLAAAPEAKARKVGPFRIRF